ncbi:YwiC-like family protein [Alkalihalobacterium chitinilyticum]|uniref:YwiC-like family protein n=1 Tax=Alkalihalobacterium chitinilyticum TaxID=2980103 RepID=A0ABT5VKE7_9BACI|nr:YwiC-like family protein [Alkalihalobacterium chitinilyticum]MDE5415909.1 YwiC-like family protein [Alkalihalobacterium chitinilyticum]
MKLYIPREHGAWAMLIIPYLLGSLFSNTTWTHFIFFIGILSFYFATGPVLSYIRKPKLGKSVVPALLLYILIGSLFIIPVLIKYPFLLLLFLMISPCFLINMWFAKLKKERLFINDVIAIIGFSFLVMFAFYIGNGEIPSQAYFIMFLNISFFIGSVFHVKTFIRERGNKRFHKLSNFYHGGLIIVPVLLGLPFVALALAVSSIKTWIMPKKNIKPITLGLIELGNSVAFVLLLVLFI